mgnify:CR=1 FL=1
MRQISINRLKHKTIMKTRIRILARFAAFILTILMLPLVAWGRLTDSPNIIFILVDDHRWDALSILGYPLVQTPNLDRLYREGVRFENAFVTTSLCSPSLAGFLTGPAQVCMA